MSKTYHLRDGTPTDVTTWAKLQGDASYIQVETTNLPNGRWVSTIWLGIAEKEPEGSALIFETVVFNNETRTDVDSVRNCSEAEARSAHASLVEKWR